MVQFILSTLFVGAHVHVDATCDAGRCGETLSMIQQRSHHADLDRGDLEVDVDVDNEANDGPRLISTCVGQKVAAPQEQPFEKLTFVHIPRNGGSSIVDCTRDERFSNNRWGFRTDELGHSDGLNESLTSCPRRTVPPNLLDLNYYRKLINQNTFCVVRDPFARLISQHGHAVNADPDKRSCTKKDLNQYLLENLQSLAWDAKEHNRESSDCHFLPQVAYTHGWNHKKGWLNKQAFDDGAKRYCKHVLHYEGDLSENVNELFKAHGYPYRLQDRQQGNALSPKKCNFKPEDLADHVVLLAERLYEQDFDTFGYKRLSAGRGLEKKAPVDSWKEVAKADKVAALQEASAVEAAVEEASLEEGGQ